MNLNIIRGSQKNGSKKVLTEDKKYPVFSDPYHETTINLLL